MTCEYSREEYLKRIQQLGFMTDDIRLFLNTHPRCDEALCALKRYILLERAAKKQYEENYGSLTLEAVGQKERYDWIDGPWPWERED
ncbi:MAG: spore coat protein CotJB [Eubacteriales bacterium]|nr:spore coat protein CotJB [Eubacteriales bacterium]MDD3880926.1 spore coat protein CotJB [Eubacteriales bacterium]MDD4511707.1 spore coat protein CotJB [Eubacteriales bacterium]